MDGPTLSRREQQILAGIEEELRTDARLELQLRTMRLHRLWHLWQFVRGEREIFGLLGLGAVGVLLVAGLPSVRFGSTVLMAGLGLLILAGAAGLVRPVVLCYRRRHPDRPAGAREEAV